MEDETTDDALLISCFSFLLSLSYSPSRPTQAMMGEGGKDSKGHARLIVKGWLNVG